MKTRTKAFQGINTYVLLFSILIVVTILTHIIPAGQYEMIEDPVTGRSMVDPESFHYVDRNPTSIYDMFKAIPKGLVDGAHIAFSIFIIAGVIGIVRATGAIDAGLLKIIKISAGREKLFIPLSLIVLSLPGAFLGLTEIAIVMIPLVVDLVRRLGYDSIVAVSCSYLALQLGFFTGIMNPFNVGIAHEMAQLPIYSAISFRIIMWVIFICVTSWYTLAYASKIKKNPDQSLVADIQPASSTGSGIATSVPLTTRHKIIYLLFILGFFSILYGAYQFEWGIDDISAVFLMLGVISGIISGLTPTKIADEFISGAKAIVFGALIVGFARAIYLVMKDSLILDTMIYSLLTFVQVLPRSISVIGMYIVQWVLNILIPSATGQAAISIPIMIPLADVLGITRQTAIIAYQLGDGINNSIIPTSSTLLAVLTLANVPYDRWVKYLYKLTILWTIIGIILLLIAHAINIGPF